MRDFDPRVTPVRADLAAKFLEGKVPAPRYVEGRSYEVIAPQAPLRQEPRPDAPLDTEALKGERVTIYDENEEGWAWGQLAADNYVGWLPLGALAAPGVPPTHKVAALRTFAFPGAVDQIAAASRPSRSAPSSPSTRIEDRMAVTDSGFYVPAVHLQPVGDNEADFVAVAERFLGAPYLWGGKTVLGLDCSGLVQIALAACGVPCPRDTDMQERALGPAVGDLVILRSSAAIWYSGRATSRSCATPRICFTPMPSTWRWRSSRSPKPWPASVPRAAKSPACGGSGRYRRVEHDLIRKPDSTFRDHARSSKVASPPLVIYCYGHSSQREQAR